MSLLQITNLNLSIHGAPILKDVSLNADAGEIVAITGESGSGKSMTALAAMQLLPNGAVARGRIMLDGQDILEASEADLCAMRGNKIGMVFQEPMTALNPLHRIGDQVAETIRVHTQTPRAKAQHQAAETLARVGLPPDDFPLSRYPHELSGGQRQRVVIAMAIARHPRVLIADEPTTALDVTTQAQILDLLVRLAREDDMALLLITHDLAVVAQIADRLSVMRQGEIVEAGPTRDLLHNMQHPYTKALFRASSPHVDLPARPTPTPLLEARNLVRSYALPRRRLFAKPQQFDAVRGVSFTLSRGERLGLVGESGCGKSTLTRALLGLEPVQGGTITLAGQQLYTHNSSQQSDGPRMQVVFQDPFGSFNPRHTVGRLLVEPFHALDEKPAATTIAEALTAVGLHPQDSDRYIHEFSGGQRQRIAIARALITRPDVIIFDEAVSALDVSVRAQILDLLATLCRTHNLTYLFISHDLTVVRSVTDTVMVMQAGQIVEHGPTEAVFTNPQHKYTKTLLAAAPKLPDLEGVTSAG